MNGRDMFATVVLALAAIGCHTVLRHAMRSLKSAVRVLGAIVRTIAERCATPAPSDAPTTVDNPRNPEPSDAAIRAFLARNKLVLVQADQGESS